jgi:hypothetical protein
MAATLAACRGTLSPLSHRIAVGADAYAVYAADGEDAAGDLFAIPAGGGTSYQITFTRLDERLPALSPDGSLLAFVRGRTVGDTAACAVWLMNLINGAERRLTEEGEANPTALGWSVDGTSLYLRTAAGTFAAAVPPDPPRLTPLSGAALAHADSALALLLGDPPLAEAIACPDAPGLCARMLNGTVASLAPEGSQAARWGTDSIAYLERGEYHIRPLAGGTTRLLRRTGAEPHPRGLTYFGGREATTP